MDQNSKFKVAVNCMTYNHAEYIEDALNGFKIQETSFPVAYLVVDDASSDKEPEILYKWALDNLENDNRESLWKDKTYGKLAVAPLKGKSNSLFVIALLSENHYRKGISWKKSEYIAEWIGNAEYRAMCEGDDYWTDLNKLEKQVEYLDAHKDVNICVHNAEVFLCETGERIPFNNGINDGIYDIKDVVRMKWFTPTASFVYRNNFELLPIWISSGCNGDMAILYSNLLKGKLYYDSEIKSVYRYGTPSSFSASFNEKQLVRKKLNLYKTINRVSHYKYILYIAPQALKLRIMQTTAFKWVNDIRLRMREKLTK